MARRYQQAWLAYPGQREGDSRTLWCGRRWKQMICRRMKINTGKIVAPSTNGVQK